MTQRLSEQPRVECCRHVGLRCPKPCEWLRCYRSREGATRANLNPEGATMTVVVPAGARASVDDGSGRFEFLVVGAGPVGLTTAMLLGRRGHRVLVVERWPVRYPLPRACTIDHEALRILQSAGVMQHHNDLFEPSRGERGGYQIRNGAGELLRQINWNRPAESGWANTNGFYQPDLEAALETMAGELPTVEIRRGCSAVGVDQDDTGVNLTIQSTSGTTSRVRGNWLIACDGANSAIRGLVGLESASADFEADWLVVDYQPIVDREWDAFVTQYCDPAQPATAVKSGPGRRRFEFMRRQDITVEELGRPETAWRLMQPWNVTPANARLERHAVYTFRGRWADEWRRGRVLLAGDAAHLMPPFLGQGLCAGLRDASALAWRLSMIADGQAAPSVLDSYTTERRAHVREIIDAAIDIGKVICELDPKRAAQRDARMKAELADETVEPPHPRLGQPSLARIGDEHAGTLSVQGRVEVDGRAGLFDEITGGSWQLIGLDIDPMVQVGEELREWFAEIGGTSTAVGRRGAVRDVDDTYRTWFGTHDCRIVLSRPDFYIYGTGDENDVADLLDALRATLTGLSVPTRSGAAS
ncbi:bifunctional 3-(3-hydroxy-phenyl)propionate/3-hydroxycinnamic acid hydroxylase [Nakamurella sp. A5-74]|uniref:Bifunctional 3-(3-hydroxy-phenyl)propionate/3-hydroxycinnamic acid hydroxylase n=1 Tax=Nakamurella sp. A5-74 TaxID=3158264 RepID=A0AAU8DLL6_9ACTN